MVAPRLGRNRGEDGPQSRVDLLFEKQTERLSCLEQRLEAESPKSAATLSMLQRSEGEGGERVEAGLHDLDTRMRKLR